MPIDENGDVKQNTWAFFPVFPALVRLVTLAGLDYFVAATVVATVFGLLATLALHRMLAQHFAPTQALWGAIFFASGPLSWLLQVGYAESTYLFFLFCALAAMVSRHYLLMIPFALVASFSHPAGGVLCRRCASLAGSSRQLPPDARESLRRWIGGNSAVLADEPSRRAHQRLLREFVSEHLADGRPLRAYDVWERSGWAGNGRQK